MWSGWCDGVQMLGRGGAAAGDTDSDKNGHGDEEPLQTECRQMERQGVPLDSGKPRAGFAVPGVGGHALPAMALADSAPDDAEDTVTWGTGSAGPLTARF